MNKLYIGIDPGTKTGFAVWDPQLKRFTEIRTMMIHQAMIHVNELDSDPDNVLFLRIEDARTWKGFGKQVYGRDQGAGSIKRDCSIWEDFCKDMGLNFEMTNLTYHLKKLTQVSFKIITGHKEKTSEHARDAAMLVFEYKKL